MIIEDAFDLAAPPECAWSVLNDIPRVAGCILNAKITAIVDKRMCKAKVAVKIEPVSVGYRATVTVTSVDETMQTATLDVRGDELKGRGGVRAHVISHTEECGDGYSSHKWWHR